ncbi:MAG TPA: cation:proton antiporter [Terriglobia bacterium]|nr:cation:proton antiporter [Terriglobia bacterium]
MSVSLQILIFTSLLIVVSKLMGGLAARLGLPVVLGELLAGVLLGPTAIDVWGYSWFSHTGPPGTSLALPALIRILAEMGVVVLMFLAGLETDVSLMRKTVSPALWTAIGGVIVPLAAATYFCHWVGFALSVSLFIGTILTATSVSITAQTLMQLGQLQSLAGSTILGAAVIDDVLGLIVLSLVVALLRPASAFGGWEHTTALTLGRLTVFCVLTFAIGPRLVRWIFRQTRRLQAHHAPVAMGLALAFGFAFIAQYFGGLAAITGAYLVGLFTAATSAQKDIVADLRSITNSFFGPLFFVSVGLEVNVWKISGGIGVFFLVLAIAVFGKIFGCGLGSWLKGFGLRDACVIGIGMVPRGEVGLIAASLGWEQKLISTEIYSLCVVLVLITTLITPAALRLFHPSMPFSPSRAQIEVEPDIAHVPVEGDSFR